MPSWAARSDYSVLRKGRMTMEGAQKYRVVAWWSSGRTGLAKSNSAPNAIHFTAPLEYADLEVEVEGMILKTDSGYSFSEIAIRPSLTISSDEEQTRALRILQKAKTMCLVSRALSVEQKFEPRVQAGEPRAEC